MSNERSLPAPKIQRRPTGFSYNPPPPSDESDICINTNIGKDSTKSIDDQVISRPSLTNTVLPLDEREASAESVDDKARRGKRHGKPLTKYHK